jgi:hypothetical protein
LLVSWFLFSLFRFWVFLELSNAAAYWRALRLDFDDQPAIGERKGREPWLTGFDSIGFLFGALCRGSADSAFDGEDDLGHGALVVPLGQHYEGLLLLDGRAACASRDGVPADGLWRGGRLRRHHCPYHLRCQAGPGRIRGAEDLPRN